MLLKQIYSRIAKVIRENRYNIAAKFFLKLKINCGLNNNQRKEEVVVSLTSHGERLNKVHFTIRSILNQTYKADRVVLYLGPDVAMNDLPRTLIDLLGYGLNIKFVNEDMGPHTKYFYSVKEFPTALVITVDDDQIYPQDLIENLVSTHQQYPNAVVASRVHEILVDDLGNLFPYMNWGWEVDAVDEIPSLKYLATGCGGVLYPPRSLADEMINKELIKKLAWSADDLWLKAAEVMTNTPVKMAKGYMWKRTYEDPSSFESALGNSNVIGGVNDIVIHDILQYFDWSANKLINDVEYTMDGV